ncbi:MAG: hypothetical protein A2086_16195 [Spirochaetes bacterium GWD1_27_9]|nr:MAG: hypothetical protein A2Z98_13605 [Spirochaetes bacterium GWB1_27_13]OHD27604.1 MAG: hypothetical protein A2Y34_18255 [Spirochaetes bacterium GWC1_27_15]OHD38269.1 MAG: hypothetical protein A2086_16195 [Spirochaetes bacterium GWD1_27_9]
MIFRKILFFILMNFFILTISTAETMLSSDIIKIIDDSVFEVVVLKPTKDSLTYEKPLPFDLIPFAIRNDKYYSVGTAFAISENKFVTASHVISLPIETLTEQLFIRDKKGNVNEIDQIYSYSNNKDFVVFTIKDKKVSNFLKINTTPNINDDVFAVGNAYGEGIIIRNGILTSKTPEEENGKWEWLRFSAAASPGNSGGPLLNKNGEIIGIVLRKSENENLNYALPINIAIESNPNLAKFHYRINYSIPIMSPKKINIFDDEVTLPKSYIELKKYSIEKYHSYCVKTLDDLIKENKNAMFPNTKGSLQILHNTFSTTFPNIIAEGEGGSLGVFKPKEIEKSNLENNGFIEYGELGGYDLINLVKPDNISLKQLCDDSKLFMDLVLKGITYNRNVSNQKIRIISLGEAVEKYDFVDNYKRKWLIRSWNLEYVDYKLTTFSLLTPTGMVSILKIGQFSNMNSGDILDIKVITDYIYLSYYGTFKQWEEFLTSKDYLPEIFTNFELSYTNNKTASIKTKRLQINYKNESFEITPESDMKILISYLKENDNIIWDIAGIYIWENKNSNNYFAFFKELKPVEGLNDSYFSEWEKMWKQKYPYNATSYFDNGNTYIRTVHSNYSTLKNKLKIDNNFLYTAYIGLEGKINNFKMQKKLKDMISSTTILE